MINPPSGHSFGQVLRKYREQTGLTQQQICEQLGVSKNTVCNWQGDRSSPDATLLRALCLRLHIPLYELFGLDLPQHSLTREEDSLLQLFRGLSGRTRRTALHLLTALADDEQAARRQDLLASYCLLPLQNTSAAAGSGSVFADESETEHRFVRRSAISQRADTLVRVSGRSMEPVYHDGDLLYVLYTDSGHPGDDLICSTADGAVVKRMSGAGQLYSVNPAYPFADKYDDDNVRIMGRVLGIAADDELAAAEDIPLLQALFEPRSR